MEPANGILLAGYQTVVSQMRRSITGCPYSHIAFVFESAHLGHVIRLVGVWEDFSAYRVVPYDEFVGDLTLSTLAYRECDAALRSVMLAALFKFASTAQPMSSIDEEIASMLHVPNDANSKQLPLNSVRLAEYVFREMKLEIPTADSFVPNKEFDIDGARAPQLQFVQNVVFCLNLQPDASEFAQVGVENFLVESLPGFGSVSPVRLPPAHPEHVRRDVEDRLRSDEQRLNSNVWMAKLFDSGLQDIHRTVADTVQRTITAELVRSHVDMHSVVEYVRAAEACIAMSQCDNTKKLHRLEGCRAALLAQMDIDCERVDICEGTNSFAVAGVHYSVPVGTYSFGELVDVLNTCVGTLQCGLRWIMIDNVLTVTNVSDFRLLVSPCSGLGFDSSWIAPGESVACIPSIAKFAAATAAAN